MDRTCTDLMVDLETMGTQPGCVIVQIGLCAFGLNQAPNADMIRVDPQSCVDAGLTMDWDTVKWWMVQGDEARRSLVEEGISLRQAIVQLSELKVMLPKLKRVWSHGASFDLPILAAAATAVGLELPWDYRMIRDTRTLMELVPSVVREKPIIPHRADCDAVAQAITIQKCMQAFPAIYG